MICFSSWDIRFFVTSIFKNWLVKFFSHISEILKYSNWKMRDWCSYPYCYIPSYATSISRQSSLAALTKMSCSGHPTDSPLKVKKVWIWCGRVVGSFTTRSAILNPCRYMPMNPDDKRWTMFANKGNGENPSTINNFFYRELNSKNSVLDVWRVRVQIIL